MTTQELKDVLFDATTIGGSIAMAVAPQYAAYVALGKIAAKVAPEVFDSIVKLIQKKDPTPEEVNELNTKIAILMSPEKLYV